MKVIKIIALIIILTITGIWISSKLIDKYKVKPKIVYTGKAINMKQFEVSSAWVVGAVECADKMEIYPEITGIVEEIHVKEGLEVKKGQKLATLKNNELLKKLEEAKDKLKEEELNVNKTIEENKTNIIQKEITMEDANNQLFQIKSECQINEKKDQETIKTALRALEEAKAGYEIIKKDFTSQIAQAELSVKQAEINKKSTEADLNRYKELFEAKVISKKQMEDAQNRYENTLLQHQYTLKNVDNLKLKQEKDLQVADLKIKECEYILDRAKEQPEITELINEQKILAAEQKVRKCEEAVSSGLTGNQLLASEKLSQARKNFELAQNDYSRTIILSPISGTVSFIDKSIKLGKEVNTASQIMIIADLNKLIIKAKVNQVDISWLKENQKVKITGGIISKAKPITGKLISISPMAYEDESKNENNSLLFFEAIVSFDSGDYNLRPGMEMDLEFVTGSKENVLAIPSEAIIRKGGNAYVYLFDNNKARKTEVKTGLSDIFRTEILSGITEKDKIIVEWEDEISDGELVEEKTY